ncbi:MAG: hypothetical protein ACEY3D_04200 [Rickettsia sp.]|uniref:hypothetical protein n=1 Tax=Rickettsia sp. TaxID=789 RepID=UPI00397DEF22
MRATKGVVAWIDLCHSRMALLRGSVNALYVIPVKAGIQKNNFNINIEVTYLVK